MSTRGEKSRLEIHDDAELAPKASIRGTLASIWGVTLLLSVYAAASVSNELDGWERLQAIFDPHHFGDGLEALQGVTGLSRLHQFLEERRHQINDIYAVGRLEETPEAPDTPDTPNPPDTPQNPEEGRPVHIRAPAKHRVLVIGASSIQFALGVELERAFPTYEKVKAKRFGQLATSLARPDFFNWQEKAKSLIEEFKPDLVVTNFGGNDAQDILLADGTKVLYSTDDWEPAFRGLVTDLIELGKKNGADTVMIGMPVMREDKFTKKMKRLNAAMKEATEAAGALYVSAWELSSNDDGEYLTQVKYGGKRGLMRTSDGVHYSKLGAQLVVDATLELLERRYHFVPKDETLGPAEPHGFESKLLERPLRYVIYRPHATDPAVTERPLILLDLGAEPASLWPGRHPHRRLQKLAQSEGVRLVLLSGLDGLGEGEQAEALLTDELLPDLEAHFPSGGKRGLISATGRLDEAARKHESPLELGPLEGGWDKSLEATVKALSLKLRAPAP